MAGHTRDELFHIWTGSGSNGKSIAIGMFQNALGDYATTISITLLTKSRNASSAASPEMIKTKGKRMLPMLVYFLELLLIKIILKEKK